jgi:hypothetical protein
VTIELSGVGGRGRVRAGSRRPAHGKTNDESENRVELARMVVFALQEPAKRIAALAEQVRTGPLRARLFALVDELEREATVVQEGIEAPVTSW